MDPSTFEGNGTTETELRACVQDANLPGGELVKPTVEVDRKFVPVTDVETPLLNIDLPAENIWGRHRCLPGKVCPWGAAGSRSYTR